MIWCPSSQMILNVEPLSSTDSSMYISLAGVMGYYVGIVSADHREAVLQILHVIVAVRAPFSAVKGEYNRAAFQQFAEYNLLTQMVSSSKVGSLCTYG